MKSLYNISIMHFSQHQFSSKLQVFIYSVILLFFGFIVVSCDSNRVYETNKSIEEGNWSKIDTACFDVDVVDTLSLNNFYINLRHSTSYKYSNIFLFFHTTFPNGYSTSDTLQILLADNTGKWIGAGLGKIKECRVLLKDRVQFPHSGIYSFCIEQAMRTEPLEGIEDIGIRIERME